MGTSTNAILAFGFDLGVEDTEELPEKMLEDNRDIDEEDGFDFNRVAAKMAGIEQPSVKYEGNEEAWRAYWKKQSDAAKACPIDLITHCSYDCPMYFLAVRGTKIVANRGFPELAVMPPISGDQLQALRDFCARYEIDWQEPAWHIFSLWG